MSKIIALLIILMFYGCNKPKTVLICGDHVCVNKDEAKQFFEDNLSLEVRVIDKKKLNEIDLVELNLKSNQSGDKEISVLKKDKTKKKLKELSNEEIKNKKSQIKQRKKALEKIENKENNDNQIIKKSAKKKNSTNKKLVSKKNVNKTKIEFIDICTMLEKCNIEEISKYLVNQGNKKKFPDITNKN